MPKLIITQGLPGSGKSHWAKNVVKEWGNTIRVNRDDLRMSLFGLEGVIGKRESLVTSIQRASVKEGLEANYNVIVDDTNLNPKTLNSWKNFALELNNINTSANVDFEVKDFTDISLSTCIHRDMARGEAGGRCVGAGVIYNMALNTGLIKFYPWDDLVLVDMDGTLSDCSHRVKYAQEGPDKNWDTFFKLCIEDPCREEVKQMVLEFADEGKTIVIVSARPEKCGYDTRAWLVENNIPYTYLFMRKNNDKSDDTLVKKAILDKLPKSQITYVIDDRPKVLRMWAENGLNCIDVGDGKEF